MLREPDLQPSRPREELLADVYRRGTRLRRRRRIQLVLPVVIVVVLLAGSLPFLLGDSGPLVGRISPADRGPAKAPQSPEPGTRNEGARARTEGTGSAPSTEERGGVVAGGSRGTGSTSSRSGQPGGRIVFTSADSGDGVPFIAIVDAEGSGYRRLSSGYNARLSPDGKQVAFVDGCCSGGVLYVMSSDGSNRKKVSTGFAVMHPSWSPDSTRIAYTAAVPGGVSGPNYSMVPFRPGYQWDINTIRLATGEITSVTRTPEHEVNPEWSPDGARIAYAMGEQIFSVDADGTDNRRLYSATGLSGLDWSPDGSRIAYTADEGLIAMRADGSDTRQIADAAYGEPAWSPDGRSIAFYALGSDDVFRVRVVDSDGSPLRELGRWRNEGPVLQLEPSFSPDSNHIGYCAEGGLWRARRDGTDKIRLVDGICLGEASWSS